MIEHGGVQSGHCASILAVDINPVWIYVRARREQINAAGDVESAHSNHRLADQQSSHGIVVVSEVVVKLPAVDLRRYSGLAQASGIDGKHNYSGFHELVRLRRRICLALSNDHKQGRFLVSSRVGNIKERWNHDSGFALVD